MNWSSILTQQPDCILLMDCKVTVMSKYNITKITLAGLDVCTKRLNEFYPDHPVTIGILQYTIMFCKASFGAIEMNTNNFYFLTYDRYSFIDLE